MSQDGRVGFVLRPGGPPTGRGLTECPRTESDPDTTRWRIVKEISKIPSQRTQSVSARIDFQRIQTYRFPSTKHSDYSKYLVNCLKKLLNLCYVGNRNSRRNGNSKGRL